MGRNVTPRYGGTNSRSLPGKKSGQAKHSVKGRRDRAEAGAVRLRQAQVRECVPEMWTGVGPAYRGCAVQLQALLRPCLICICSLSLDEDPSNCISSRAHKSPLCPRSPSTNTLPWPHSPAATEFCSPVLETDSSRRQLCFTLTLTPVCALGLLEGLLIVRKLPYSSPAFVTEGLSWLNLTGA